MNLAYITSLYPAVSQTFILREVRALRAEGFRISTFSVRRAAPEDCLGAEAQREQSGTRWLVPARISDLVRAASWVAFRRPLSALRVLAHCLGGNGRTIMNRVKSLAHYGEAMLLAHWLDHERIEHLHCHFGNSGSTTASLAARLARIPFSMTCHGSELRDPVRYRLREKVRQAAFVACVSHFGRAQLLLACPPEDWPKLHVIRCGFDLGTTTIGGFATKEPSSGPSCWRLLCVGRLSPEKGHLVLLDALADLCRRREPVQCKLVGEGPMRAAIERRIETLELKSCVTLMGALPPESVQPLYREADVVVLSSFSEGVPVVLMEALAEARPVVASSVGGVPELVIHGETGLLVPPGDSESLAEALLRLRREPALAQALALQGRLHVTKEFRVDVSAAKLAKLFRSRERVVTANTPAGEWDATVCQTPTMTPNSC